MADPSGQQSLVVGAANDCDIVIDQPTVSGRHCRLTRTSEGFFLQDLGSTNGTFVNDVQLDDSTRVTRQDQITLGQTVPLEWSRIEEMLERRVARKLPMMGGLRTLVADKKSAAFLWTAILLAIIGLVVAGIFLSGRWAAPRHQAPDAQSDDKPASANAPPASTPESASVPAPEADPVKALYLVLVKDVEQSQIYRLGTAWAIGPHRLVTTAGIIKVADRMKKEFPLAAVYCPASGTEVSLRRSERKTHPNYEVAYTRLRKAQQEYDELRGEMERLLKTVQSGDTPTDDTAPAPKELVPAAAGEQPSSSANHSVVPDKPPATVAEKPSNSQTTEEKERIAKKFERLKKELVKWDSKAFEAAEEMNYFDIGVLDVQEELPVFLSVAGPNVQLRGNASVVLFGIPVPTNKHQMVADDETAAAHLDGHITRLPILDQQNPKLFRFEIATASVVDHASLSDVFSYQWWVGSPILDAKTRQVIGVYSRLTPNFSDPQKSPPGDRHDAVCVARLRELLTLMP